MRISLVILLILAGACGGKSADDSTPHGSVAVRVVAGPTCPVAQPGDPQCKPRPVKQASLAVEDASGETVATLTVAEGSARGDLGPGRYTLVPGRADGLMGTGKPISFEVTEGQTTRLTVLYDTGIR
jgi:hypothetical protein